MGLAYTDYALPAVNDTFTFSVGGTQTSALVALASPIPIPTTTGGWFAVPLVRVNSSYDLASGDVNLWTFISSCALYDASGAVAYSWTATYMRTYYIGDLQTSTGALGTYTSGLTHMAVSVQATRAGTPSAMDVTVSALAGNLRVFYQTASGTVPGCEAYKDQSMALPAVLSAGADGLAINRLRYRIQQATASSGKFYGLPIGSTLKRYS